MAAAVAMSAAAASIRVLSFVKQPPVPFMTPCLFAVERIVKDAHSSFLLLGSEIQFPE